MQRGKPKNRLLDFWVGTPLLNILATFHRHHPPPVAIRRIGVMCSPALGDTLLFSAALQDIRAAYPAAHITHICMKQNLAAAEIIPGADARIFITLTSPFSSIAAIRAQHFDVLFDFTSWQRLTAFYTLMSGAKYTVGFETPTQHRSRGYDRTVLHSADRHEVGNFHALLGGCGLDIPAVHLPAIDVPAMPSPFAAEPDIVVLHLWASGQRSWLREWPEDRWLGLAARIRDKYSHPNTVFILTGAPSDLPRAEPFLQRMLAAGFRTQIFISPDGFRTLTTVLRQARLVVSVNTGVMHLAAIAGAPTVSINGPNRNSRWGPIGPYAIGVDTGDADCGFLHLGFNFDGNPTDCMERISVQMVYSVARLVEVQAEIDAKEGRR